MYRGQHHILRRVEEHVGLFVECLRHCDQVLLIVADHGSLGGIWICNLLAGSLLFRVFLDCI